MQESPQELSSHPSKTKGQLMGVFSPGFTGFLRTGEPIGLLLLSIGILIFFIHFQINPMPNGLLIGIGITLLGLIIIIISMFLVHKQKFFIYQDGFEFAGTLIGEKIEGRIFWEDITDVRVTTRETIRHQTGFSKQYRTKLSNKIHLDTYTRKNLIIDLRNYSHKDGNMILNAIIDMVNRTTNRNIKPMRMN
ncbi:MAG: hypothetical protein GF308_21465 [Candidatus Heimdallarchaeota archaeon]|nr:hypothetical protein [Candidatus Heimdallarchaeota archaeon]